MHPAQVATEKLQVFDLKWQALDVEKFRKSLTDKPTKEKTVIVVLPQPER